MEFPHRQADPPNQHLLHHDPTTQAQPPAKAQTRISRRGVQWRSPALMMLLFFAGIVFAIGHHIYYQSLDDTPVTSTSQQEWAIRIGTGLAFLVKATLAASIGIAFTQYLWTVATRKAMALQSIDDMFSLTKNPASFANFEVLVGVKLLVLLAMASWFMPLIATVTPSTLSVYTKMVTNVSNVEVPCMGFANDPDIWSDSMGAGFINEPSPAVTRLLTATSSSIGILPMTASFPNSSYSLQFYAPALKCEKLSDAVKNGQPVGSCNNCTSLQKLWDTSIDISNGANYNYWQAVMPDGSHNLLFIRTGAGKLMDGDPKNISCQLWNAPYTTLFTFRDGIQTTKIQSLEYESTTDFNTSVAFTELPDGGRAYLSMYLAMSNLLSGEVGVRPGLSSSGMLGTDLAVAKTGLMACPDIIKAWETLGSSEPPLDRNTSPWMCRNNSVAATIEDLSQNFTLSLLSSPMLNGNTTTDVEVRSPRNYWRYSPVDLLIAYVAGAAVALFCIVVGGWAYMYNGYSATSSFSSILLTTRNPDLDGLTVKQCLPTYPLQENIGKAKLKFGVVGGANGIEHAAFGLPGSMQHLKRGYESG
ncbi:formylmethionine deformylase-like protein [Diplodia corticola]|uniref:Formylmethionine deformylase-like protein n=1 Tax=Diplodia corticola TaxID=236234 RepID=A0A1J9RQ31_9PEZI|nr:formylmethionine deformylase-like protein [Diplodia corticola]OJD30020.1 formylmethionine deformylase-like protein [Diplodia corticola]